MSNPNAAREALDPDLESTRAEVAMLRSNLPHRWLRGQQMTFG